MIKLIWLLFFMLPGCAVKPVTVTTTKLPSNMLQPAEGMGTNDFPQVKLIEENIVKATNTTDQLLDHALKYARQQPEEYRFLNATTIYDFIPGQIYRVYTAPQKITMISFEPGEAMVAPPQSGDTVRWQINSIKSGDSYNFKQHLIIKPLRDGLSNNMIVATNRSRVYLLELISLKHSYMAEISWNYLPHNSNNLQSSTNEEQPPKKFNFNYKIINKRGKPNWRPSQVFDDGQKTFIQFAANINQHELPSLFIVSRETNNQLVNYRQHGNCFIVDQLFQEAELRLGLTDPYIIRIKRIK